MSIKKGQKKGERRKKNLLRSARFSVLASAMHRLFRIRGYNTPVRGDRSARRHPHTHTHIQAWSTVPVAPAPHATQVNASQVAYMSHGKVPLLFIERASIFRRRCGRGPQRYRHAMPICSTYRARPVGPVRQKQPSGTERNGPAVERPSRPVAIARSVVATAISCFLFRSLDNDRQFVYVTCTCRVSVCGGFA